VGRGRAERHQTHRQRAKGASDCPQGTQPEELTKAALGPFEVGRVALHATLKTKHKNAIQKQRRENTISQQKGKIDVFEVNVS